MTRTGLSVALDRPLRGGIAVAVHRLPLLVRERSLVLAPQGA